MQKLSLKASTADTTIAYNSTRAPTRLFPRMCRFTLLLVAPCTLACDQISRVGKLDASRSSAAIDSGPESSTSAEQSPSTPPATPDAGTRAAEHYAGPYLGATGFQALIMSEPEWPANPDRPKSKKRRNVSEGSKSIRLGYMRRGAKAPVNPIPVRKNKNCAEGWFQLIDGGYVCGRYATLDLSHPKFKLNRPPDPNGPLPYTYGINGSNGTPLYREVPSREQRREHEPWLTKPKKKKANDDTEDDAGLGEEQAANEKLPWYLRDHDASAPPQVTLEELEEDDDSIVAKRMVKGFYLSIDERFTANGSTWWTTVDGMVAPADRVWLAKPPSDYRGVWIGRDRDGNHIDKLPVGFVISRNAHKWKLSDDKRSASQSGSVPRLTIVGLTGTSTSIKGKTYEETTEGWWLALGEGTKTEPGPLPEKLGSNEKWIDVNLERQTLVAFVGEKPVFATVVSSGRKDHETPPGTFRIREKHISATMDGNADTAADGPYSIQDVPYIQYFNGGYALHGAFWHQEFGRVKSHGCVNLAPWDARDLFHWSDPQLPEGWHGAWSSSDRQGTRVIVH